MQEVKKNILISKIETLRKRFSQHRLNYFVYWLLLDAIPRNLGIPIPRHVMPGFYVGGQFSPLGKIVLQLYGIKCLVNMRSEFDDRICGLSLKEYCYPPGQTKSILEQFDIAVTFIEQKISEKKKTYVHCRHGRHRAPSVIAAYFMKQGYNFEDALMQTRELIPFCDLNEECVDSLELRKWHNEVLHRIRPLSLNE